MMSRFICITLCILHNIFFTNGQAVQSMPPAESCVPQSVSLRCPLNYVVVVKSAFYGVAQTTNLCSYQAGDCIADAMSSVACLLDTVQCNVYAVKKKLPECNDRYNNYIHIEYDCVPMSMTDSSKEYNVCQNGTEITTTNGIIRSPGYPTQFQTTTTECFRAIHVANDKTIRLWLSDLYISQSGSCAKDHVYVVDSVQTFRLCGSKRYAYPYLCSSTILIQYFVTTQLSLYRGMRMYFEIIDRPANDGCPNPNGTVTPVPATTPIVTTIEPDVSTNPPTYVTLGIASPIQNVQICKGESRTIQCPNNYVIVVRTNIFGVTLSNQCETHDADKHCVDTTSSTLACRQQCTYFYAGNQQVPTCENKLASYQYVEYQCIPTNTELVSTNTACPANGSKMPIQIIRRGRFRNYNYPTFQSMNCTYRLKTGPGLIMNIYSLDISINNLLPDCKSNKLTFIEDGDDQGAEFCELRTYNLIYSTCSNELDLRYEINDSTQFLSMGVELYIESQTRPSDWSCGKPLVTTTKSTIQTQPFTTPTAKPVTTSDPIMTALAEVESDICVTTSFNYPCPSGYTFMIISAYYGVKKQVSNRCAFTQGDCVQEAASTITACANDVQTCFLSYSTRRRLALCSDNYADYLHITSQCVPSRPIGVGAALSTYNICSTTDNIADFNGVITSPGYPTYQRTNGECKRTITGIQDRVLKIWINEMIVASGGQRSLTDETNQPDLTIQKIMHTDDLDELERMNPAIRDTCVNDYLIIDTPQVSYVYCGKRKLAIAPICAPTITIKYKAASTALFNYRGFKLYFEWVVKPVEVICGGPIDPILTTTPIDEPLPIWAQNLQLSPILSKHVCLGTSTILRCPLPNDYVLSIIDSNYAVTGTGLCEIPSSTHCHQEASLSLTCTQSCFIQYDIPKPLAQCGNQNADYLNVDYECIPTRLPNNENPTDICSPASTDTIAVDAGMITSSQYPVLGAARTCSKKIETLPNKLWLVYIVDLFLEGSNDFGVCDAASLTIYDGNEKIIRCGSQQPQLVLISCSNIVQFDFVSTHQAIGYRGFKVYFRTIDTPNDWACKSTFSNVTTLATRTTTRVSPPTTLVPPSLQIAAYGGTTNSTRQYCTFPFTYQGNPQSTCLRTDPPIPPANPAVIQPWCALTNNFDRDRHWGFCDLGVTDSTVIHICRGQTQSLRCPPGYVIDIITAMYAAKSDGNIGTGACVFDQNDCFQSDATTVQATCAGKPTCTAVHFARTLASCQNRPSAYFHIDYNCIPNDIQDITSYNLCNATFVPQGDTRRGYILSPDFPRTPSNIDCTFDLQTVQTHQDIYLYLLDMELSGPPSVGQNCVNDRLILRADNSERELCGRGYTDLLINTCHSSLSLQLIRTANGRGRGVKFYFEFRERPPQDTCVPLVTTTTRVTPFTPSSQKTTTAGAVLPNYFPDPSSRILKTLCYLDLSGLFGTNNFQCPLNYVIVIHRAFYGKGGRCDYTPGDCTTEAGIVYRTCAGKRACSVTFLNPVTLPECNSVAANYLFVEYQCLPTSTIATNVQDFCTVQLNQIGGVSGILTSPSYPTYTQTQCPNVTFSSIGGSNLIIYMYLLDMDIGTPNPTTGECTNDYLSLSYQCYNQLYTQRFCGSRSTELLFDTCSPQDKIFASFNLLSQDTGSQRGFALLYHFLPASLSNTTSTRSTQRTTTVTNVPVGPGAVSTSIEQSTACVQQALRLNCTIPGYVLILYKVYLVASSSNICTPSPDDCYEDRTSSYNLCAGKVSCYIHPPSILIPACNNSRSSFLYTEHQCIPSRPKLNLDVCSSTNPFERVEGGAVISSLNYTSAFKQCQVQLQSNPLLGTQVHRAFKIFILSLNLPIQRSLREQGSQCIDSDPLIEIDDPEKGVTRLCGSSHSRYILETCSNTINIRFTDVPMTTTAKFTGFEIYFESIENDQCRVDPVTTPPVPTPPFVIREQVACALANGRERVAFACTPDHGLVFLQSYQFVTIQPDTCDVTQNTCHYPSDQPQGQCSGQETCSYVYAMPSSSPGNICQNSRADSTQFHYQCLPMRPVQPYPKVTFCDSTQVTGESGFIETPYYPNSYEGGPQVCSIRISLPSDNDQVTQYSVYLYIIELSIRDTSSFDPSDDIECYDSITYSDGETTKSLCGKIDQPILEYRTNKKELNLTLNMKQTLPTSQWNNWRGARLFFIVGDQTLPHPPHGSTTTAVPTPNKTTTGRTTAPPVTVDKTTSAPNNKKNTSGRTAGIIIGVLAILLVIIGSLLYYRRRRLLQASPNHQIRYDHGKAELDGTMINGSSKQLSSIPPDSLKAPATSAFSNPFYKRLQTPDVEATEDATDA